MLLALLWQNAEGAQGAAQEAVEHGAVAEHAAQHSAHHMPWIAEQVNHLLAPVVYPIQEGIMTKINPAWHGDPSNPIPTHVVMALF